MRSLRPKSIGDVADETSRQRLWPAFDVKKILHMLDLVHRVHDSSAVATGEDPADRHIVDRKGQPALDAEHVAQVSVDDSGVTDDKDALSPGLISDDLLDNRNHPSPEGAAVHKAR